jgi:galactosamine-6-phosphate isomerase
MFSLVQNARATLTSGMQLNVLPDYEQMSRAAAQKIISAVRQKPNLLLCAATGSSPTRTYELLQEEYQRAPKTFAALRVLKLDDWGGLAMDDPGSSEFYLRKHLLGPMQVSPDRYCGFESNPAVPAAECSRVAKWLAEHGPIDVCVLGLGLNGHLAMNEPAESLQPFVHVAALAPGTLQHPMLANSRRKPAFGLTLGMADLLQSRTILLLVSGSNKRPQMVNLLDQRISAQCPASFLWLHGNAVCLADAEAAPHRSIA